MAKEIINTLNAEIKENASKLGYTYVRKTFCPNCAAAIEELEREKGCYFHWANPTCALMFSKKGHPTVIACACGYRSKKKVFKESPVCKADGCNVKIGKKQLEENDGYCWKCRPPKGQTTNKPAPKAQPKESNTKGPAQQTAVQM